MLVTALRSRKNINMAFSIKILYIVAFKMFKVNWTRSKTVQLILYFKIKIFSLHLMDLTRCQHFPQIVDFILSTFSHKVHKCFTWRTCTHCIYMYKVKERRTFTMHFVLLSILCKFITITHITSLDDIDNTAWCAISFRTVPKTNCCLFSFSGFLFCS